MKNPFQGLHRDEWLGFGSVLLGIVLFSTVEVAVKIMDAAVPPLRLASFRFMLTGLLLLVPAIRKIRMWVRAPGFRDLGQLVMLGFVGVTVAIGLYHMALHYLQANVGAIVFSANPVFVAVFAPFLLGEKPSWKKTAAAVLGLAGVVVLAVPGAQAGAGWTQGIAYMCGSMIAFALYSVLSKKLMPRFGATVITCAAGLFGGLMILPVSMVFEGSPLETVSAVTLLKLLYLSGVATALAYILYFFGMLQVGASRGAMFFFLKPVLAPIFAYVILGEQVTGQIAGGAGLIVAALVLAVAAGRRTPMID